MNVIKEKITSQIPNWSNISIVVSVDTESKSVGFEILCARVDSASVVR